MARRVDLGIAVSLFLTGMVTGLLYCLFYAGTAEYYQKWFGPAVMLASGQGFVNPNLTGAPAIQEFLDRRRTRLSPEDIRPDTPIVPLTGDQKVHRYLLLSVGSWWRLSGISWRQVAVVNGALYGLAIVALYAVFRLAVGPAYAVLGALWLCFSATQLENLVHLRDYCKAPFVLASLAIMGTVALRPIPRRPLLGLSALCGGILGIGTGFRPDVAAMVPLFVVTLLVFRAGTPWRGLPNKCLALAAFGLCFVVSAAPILVAASTGTNMSHVVTLGLMDPFDTTLRLNSSIYSFGHYYNDTYVQSVVGSYAERLHDVRVRIEPFPPSNTYERMGMQYLLTLARQFPADMLTHALASVAAILELPFAVVLDYQLSPRIPLQRAVTEMYRLSSTLQGLGVPLAAGVLMGLAARWLGAGLFAAFVLAYLLGLSTLQFHLRHHFHLQFISILGLLVVVNSVVLAGARTVRGWRGVSAAWGRIDDVRGWSANLRRAGLMALLISSLTIVPLACFRSYQERDLRRLFNTYLSAEKEEIRPVFRTDDRGRVLMTWDGAPGKRFASGHYPTDYVVIDVVSDGDLAIGAIGFKYAAASRAYDLSRTMVLRFRKGVNRIFVPIHSIEGFRQFTGLEIGHGLRERLRGISRVTRLEDVPLLLDVQLSPGWQQERLFQTSRFWERGDGRGPAVYAAFRGGAVPGRGWLDVSRPTAVLTEGLDVGWSDPTMVKADGRRLLVNGEAKGPFHYLVQFKNVELPAGTLLVARGRLERGGLSVGLIKNDVWSRQVTIDQPGEFVAVVPVDETGTFLPTIANAIQSVRGRRNQAIITEVGILAAKDSP